MDTKAHEELIRFYKTVARQTSRLQKLRWAVRRYVKRGADINRAITDVCRGLGHDTPRLLGFLAGPGAERHGWPFPDALNVIRVLLDALLDEDFRLPMDLTAYRGIAVHEGDSFRVASCGFVSVSLSKQVAWDYAERRRGGRGGLAAVVQIPLVAGQPALYVPAFVSSAENEFELILPIASFHSG